MNEITNDKAITWQYYAAAAHAHACGALNSGLVKDAKDWQEIGRSDHKTMWDYLSQLL